MIYPPQPHLENIGHLLHGSDGNYHVSVKVQPRYVNSKCTACGKCVADAPPGLLKMKKNLPVITDELMHLQTRDATLRCPTGAITWLNDQTANVAKKEPDHVV